MMSGNIAKFTAMKRVTRTMFSDRHRAADSTNAGSMLGEGGML
jgi:hypothetical protein